MSERSFLFLVNPIAGTRSKFGLEAFLKDMLEDKTPYHFLYSTRQMKAAEVTEQINALGITDLVAVGGDGTVNIAAEAVLGSRTKLGILPVGSGNGLARAAGIPMKPGAAMDTILQGNTIDIDAFRVNNNFSCMLSGLGLDAAVAEAFSKSATRGFFTYTKQTLIQFFKASSYKFGIELPGSSFDTEAYFISIANSNQFGNNVTIAPRASLKDGLLDIVIVKRMRKASIPLAVIRQLRGNYPLIPAAGAANAKNVVYLQTPSLTINNFNLAPLHIDGDPMETSSSININILPAALSLIVP